MRRLIGVTVIAFALAALPGCSGGSGGENRTILMDYNYDQFATSYLGYYPRYTPVHPGATITFKQAWTGEAHTVTFGTMFDKLATALQPYFSGAKPIPPDNEPTPDVDNANAELQAPSLFGQNDVNQTAGQPCYVAAAPLPADGKACPKVKQPTFTGREFFYNSGFVPYEGNGGNSYRLTLAKDIAPGDYFYSCLLHGFGMGGFVRVVAKGEKVPSQSALNATIRSQLDTTTKLAASVDRDQRAKKWELPEDAGKIDILAGGMLPDTALPFGFVDEFYPKSFTAKVGQIVRWFSAQHSIGFHVPKYGPQLTVSKSGVVNTNLKAYNAQGFTIPPDVQKQLDDAQNSHGPTPTVVLNGGTFDDSKFINSGVLGGDVFELTFTKAGTYQYACTIHPRMVGTLVVTG